MTSNLIALLVLMATCISATDSGECQPDRQTPSKANLAKLAVLLSEDDLLKMIDKGYKIDDYDTDGATALHHAANKGYYAAVQRLIEKGASVNARSRSGMTPLMLAAQGAHSEIVNDLIKQNANVDTCNMFGWNAHMLALFNRNHAIARAIEAKSKLSLPKSFDVNCDLLTAAGFLNEQELMMAFPAYPGYIRHEPRKSVQMAMSSGADVNFVDAEGNSSLMFAVAQRKRSLAIHLLAHGADANQPNVHSETPLFLAIKNCDVSLTAILLLAGASPQHRNLRRDTPLIAAALSCDIGSSLLLLSFGASLADINDAGYNAFDIAKESGAIQMLRIFRFYDIICRVLSVP